MGRHELEHLDQEEELLKRSPVQRTVLLVGSGLGLVAFLLPLEATLSTLELVESLVLQLLDLTTQ